MKIVWSTAVLAIVLAISGCSTGADDGDGTQGDDANLTTMKEGQEEAAQAQELPANLRFDALTPVGTKLMKSAHWWMSNQDKEQRYPRPRMCASNVSKVFFLSGITNYDQEGVRNLIADVGSKGGQVFKMPQGKAAFIAKLNALNGGHIPAGTLVAGMSIKSSNPGDQHIGFIGHVDPDGTVWAYHNNWYRPENEGGVRKPFMISDANLKRGFLRQWMPTPWIKISRDASGKVVDVTALLPAIDDMDPFNPTYQVTLAVPSELAKELAAGEAAQAN